MTMHATQAYGNSRRTGSHSTRGSEASRPSTIHRACCRTDAPRTAAAGTPRDRSSHTAPSTVATLPGMYLPSRESQATENVVSSAGGRARRPRSMENDHAQTTMLTAWTASAAASSDQRTSSVAKFDLAQAVDQRPADEEDHDPERGQPGCRAQGLPEARMRRADQRLVGGGIPLTGRRFLPLCCRLLAYADV